MDAVSAQGQVSNGRNPLPAMEADRLDAKAIEAAAVPAQQARSGGFAERLGSRIGELQGALALQAAQLADSDRLNRILAERLTRAHRIIAARAAALEAARRQLVRVEEAEQASRLRAVQHALERQRQRTSAISQRNADLAAERDRVRAEARDLERRRAELERRYIAAQGHERELEQSNQRLEQRNRALEQRYRAAEQEVSTLVSHLKRVREDIERAEASTAWRLGHGATRLARRLTLRKIRTRGALARALVRIDQTEGVLAGPRLPAASPVAEPGALEVRPSGAQLLETHSPEEVARERKALATRLRAALGPTATRESWPAVSIIVLNRNGEHHLTRLVEGLREHTDYPSFELIVVDNASEDGSRELLASLADSPLAVRAVLNESNVSFADGNNQGAAVAEGHLLLFLNNDVVPFEDGWLRELVLCLEYTDSGCAGAVLLRPEERAPAGGPNPRVQHRAVRFRNRDGELRPYNWGDGDDLFDGRLGEDQPAPAVTAACLIISREEFEDLGGFDTRYRYGTEDVDLGLRLLERGGRPVGCGRAVLFHEESPTQRAEGREFMRANRQSNRTAFLERWGPRIRRRYRLARLGADPFWTDGSGPRAAITVTSLERSAGWGDWYTAHELGEALEMRGWDVRYVERRGDRWYDLPQDLDYVISLIDAFDLRKVPDGITKVVWIRNWTDRWLEREWFGAAEVILASSRGSQELVRARSGRGSILFPLATDPDRFAPMRSDAELDYVFVGNWWGKDRDIQAALAPAANELLAFYGKDWDKVAGTAPYARGQADYERLPEIYSSARIVLDDTQGPTLPYGAVNARVFDALASGAIVVSNCQAGVRELFDDDFPVWHDRESLRRSLNELLGDEEHRRALVRRYRAQVLEHHTYARRAEQLEEILEAHARTLSFVIKIGAPDWQQAERWGDLHYARALQRALEASGHRCLVQVLREWDDDRGLGYDVALHLKGRSLYRPKPGQFNVMWNISHPDELTPQECDGYDLVCVASEPFARHLRNRTTATVAVLEQATDPSLFFEERDEDVAHDLVYVANSRGVLRTVARELRDRDDIAIWGSGWDGLIDTRRLKGEFLTSEQLRRVYSSASIVLADHWLDMREHGYVSNRIYDALACGARVLCDDVWGLTERFGEHVHIYRSGQDLRQAVERLLKTPDAPEARAARREAVSVETFAARAVRLVELITVHPQAVALELVPGSAVSSHRA